MKLILAPMAGLTDFYMRDALTRLAPYAWCVTEFVRVTDQLLPRRVFRLACPETNNGWRTAAGVPVHLQLLGSDPVALAENAARAVELGAPAIDLNFGCPAKLVNRHGGGAILLDHPATVHDIVAAVRRAVPASVPVSAKMRLGVKDWSRMIDNAQGIEAAGASWLTVHARTKQDGYKPPAHWEAIARIREKTGLTVLANGEIWTVGDALRCQEITGCDSLMLGRGAVARPGLARQLQGDIGILGWPEACAAMMSFIDAMLTQQESGPRRLLQTGVDGDVYGWSERGALGRCKQWFALLTRGYPEAAALFDTIKRSKRLDEFCELLKNSVPDEQWRKAG